MKYIEKYLDYLKVVKKYSDKTILSYYDDLIEYNEFLGNNFKNILNIDMDITKEYLKYLYDRGINKNSISRKLSSIRGFYNYLVKEEILTSSPFNSIPNPKKDLYLPKFLNEEELNKIFSVCSENTPSDERDTLIIELLYATGIRVSELVNIKVKDIDRTNKSIKVLGKGDKERIVLYNNHTSRALDIYLSDAYHIFNKKSSEYLILNHNGGKLSERYVRMIIDKLVRKANLDIKISPHTIRHTFATDMLEEGADLMTVKELLGHESLNTTSIYTHITNEQIKKTYNMAHPTDIIKTYYNYKEKNMNVLIMKPGDDKKAGSKIQNRAGAELSTDYVVPSNVDIYNLIAYHLIENNTDCIIVDEAQFLTPKQVDELTEVVDEFNIPVLCYGLRADAFSHAFPGSQRLFEVADRLEELKAICKCGEKATFNLRLNKVNDEYIPVFEGEQISIDGIDADYDSVCRPCYKKLRRQYGKKKEEK